MARVPLTPELEFLCGPLTPHGDAGNLPWMDATCQNTGLAMGRLAADPATPFSRLPGDLCYYDLPLILEAQYRRTNNAEFHTLFEKVSGRLWAEGPSKGGTSLQFSDTTPRMACSESQMLYAHLFNRQEMWPWLSAYNDYEADFRILSRLDPARMFRTHDGRREDEARLFFWDTREAAYTTLFTAIEAVLNPDATRRAAQKARALRMAKDYWMARQWDDGSFRHYTPTYLGGTLVNVVSALMNSLVDHALVACHRLSADPAILTGLLRNLDWVWSKYRTDAVTDRPPMKWRGFSNILAGGDLHNPTAADGPYGGMDISHVSASNTAAGRLVFPGETADSVGGFGGFVREARQYNAMYLVSFGYAYEQTGEVKWKERGDEMMDAAFSGGDGERCYADVQGKTFGEAFRSSLTYPARRQGASVTQPPAPPPVQPPAEPPVVIPTPTPTPTPTPAPTVPAVRKVAWPSSEKSQDSVVAAQWRERYRFKRHLSGSYVEFEKVA